MFVFHIVRNKSTLQLVHSEGYLKYKIYLEVNPKTHIPDKTDEARMLCEKQHFKYYSDRFNQTSDAPTNGNIHGLQLKVSN